MSLRNVGNNTNNKNKKVADAVIVNGTETMDVLTEKLGTLEGTAMTDPPEHPVAIDTVASEAVAETPIPIDPNANIAVSAETVAEHSMQQPVIVGAVPAVVDANASAAPPMPALDISKVAPRLYVSSAPTDLAFPYAGFSMIVLCAEEYQPELPAFQGKIIHAGFNDTPRPTPQDLGVAANTADAVYKELVAGGRVLVTCAMGRNRSCFVVGLVLGRKLPAADVITAIRAARGPHALGNPTYKQLVELCAVKTVSVQQRTRMGVPTTYAKTPAAPPPAQTNGQKPKRGLLSMLLGTGLGRQRGEGRQKPAPGTGRGYYGRARARGAR